MAIKSSRSESIQDSKASGARTGLIEWINNGVLSLESHRPVGLGNLSSEVFGKALDRSGEVDRPKARLISPIPNDRALPVDGPE